MSIETARSYVDSWRQRKNVEFTVPGKAHWTLLSNLLRQCGTAGNLTTDAHIAAMAIEKGFIVYSADNDFKRFSGVTHINPLQF